MNQQMNNWIQFKKDIMKQNIQMSYLGQQIYQNLLESFSPVYQLKTYEDCIKYNRSNFHGGCNDHLNTKYENIFHSIFPYLLPQKPFGTGKNGYKKYGTKRYIADFFDPLSNTIIEIDGTTHDDDVQKLKDHLRELFFLENGYLTVRFTNDEVLKIFKLHCCVIAMEVENEQRNNKCIH